MNRYLRVNDPMIICIYGENLSKKQGIYLWILIEQYGLPQDWNEQGDKGPERYIEVQVWDDKPLMKYLR